MTPGAYAFIAFLIVLMIAIAAVAIIKAPLGYQNKTGFHLGTGVDEWEDGV